MKNKHPDLRPELTPPPARISKLPVHRGFPVPWFVAWPDGPTGEPEFRAMDGEKWSAAVRFKLCWVCGEPLGKHKVFVAGPMCGINRTSSEPPSHLECARWSAINCPFLTQRQMQRREDEFTASCPVAGVAIKRNPGVALLWVTADYTVFKDGKGGYLLRMWEPSDVEWYSHGRTATRAEVVASVESGFPILAEMAATQEGAMEELLKAKRDFEKHYPK